MQESILTTIKELLGVTAEYTAFDNQIIADINTVFVRLNKLGVGPATGYRIKGPDEVWSDYLGDDELLNNVISYIHLKVKKVFDPTASATVLQSINETIDQLEFDILDTTDFKPLEGEA